MLAVEGALDGAEYDMYTGQPEYVDAAQMYDYDYTGAAWTESKAPIAGQLDDDNHLQMEDMYGVQTKYFDISIDSSLSDCAKNQNNAVWKINPELVQFLKEIVTNKNRSTADKNDMTGNVERMIPLAATIVEVHNEHDVPIGINIPGFVPNTINSHGRFLWTIQPRTPPTQVNYQVSEPDNFLTKKMYTNWRKCDLEQLNREIQFSNDPQENYAVMRTDGLAFEVLMDAIMEGRFGDSLNPHAITQAAQISRRVEVDQDVAKQVYESIKTPLEDIEKRFFNAKDFQVRFSRADGKPFDSPHGLVGSPVNGISTQYLDTHARYTKKRAGIRLKLEYVTYN